MMEPGAARRGGMPFYKYVGNKLLTRFENRLLGTSLSEFHSGYRAYNVEALKSIPFERNSDGFNFDTQIIIQLIDAGKTIAEVPIPTYYGDEICYVNGLQYARDVSADVVRYRLAKLGFLSDDLGSVGAEYALKAGERSSHAVILRWLEQMPPGRILDLGCSGGLLSERARGLGHRVVGVDRVELPELAGRVDAFIEADLDQGLPAAVEHEGPFDVVLAGDVLEHLRDPGLVLEQVRRVMVPRGALLVSVPNFGHWYVRARALLGIFDYDQRGLLDSTHVRFFTRRSIERLLRRTGFNIVRRETTGLPLEVVRGEGGRGTGLIDMLDRATVAIRPTLFGYQFAYHCELSSVPSPSDESTPSL
jgi:2-polyprenyl-3-methyl-5-hydroxy-6-metoxy-1,4-benzoquinol methylase